MSRRWTTWLVTFLGFVVATAACAAQPREAEPDPELTDAFPELAEGEAVEVPMDASVERSFTYGPVRISVTSGVITNVDPETGEPAAPDQDWWMVLDATVTKLIDTEFVVSGSSAVVLDADGRRASNRDRERVDPGVGEAVPKRFVFRVASGREWAGSVLVFGERRTELASVALDGPVETPETPFWVRPPAPVAAAGLGVTVISAQVALDLPDGTRVPEESRYLFVEATVDTVDGVELDPTFFRLAVGEALVDPDEAPDVAVGAGSSLSFELIFTYPAEAEQLELLVRDPGSGGSALSLDLDLDDRRPDDAPFPPPTTSAATTTTTTTTTAVPEGAGVTVAVTSANGSEAADEALDQVIATIDGRLAAAGISGAAQRGAEPGTILVRLVDQADVDRIPALVTTPGRLEFRPVLDDLVEPFALGDASGDGTAVESAATRVDLIVGWVVDLVFRPGSPGIDDFNALVAMCFGRSTVCPTGRVAIVVDGDVLTAPQVQAPSFERDAIQITGDFDETEAVALAAAVSAPAIPDGVEIAVVEVAQDG